MNKQDSLNEPEERRQQSGEARRRICGLLDDASFMELERLYEQTAVTRGYECVSAPGEGVVAGFGTVDSRPVYVFAQDPAVLGGSMSSGQADKICRIMDMALRNGAPVLGILDSAGARVSEGAAAMGAYNSVLKKLSELSGVVPTIAIVCGRSIGAAAVLAASADFTVAVEGCTLLLHSPLVDAAAQGKSDRALGNAEAVCRNGIAQFHAGNDAAAFALVRKLLAYMPDNNMGDAPERPADDGNRLLPELDNEITIDTRDLIKKIADWNDFLEVYSQYAPGMVTGFIRLNGNVAGVVANVAGGTPDTDALRKAARFITLMDAYHLPILTLVDCADAEPGTGNRQLQAISALVSAYSQSSVPMVTVVYGRAVGTGLLSMCPRNCGADLVYAWRGAVISALPVEAGALIWYDDAIRAAKDPAAERQKAIGAYLNGSASSVEAARMGLVDEVIAPSETRQMVITAFEACANKRCCAHPPRKHAVRPL